MAKGKFSRFLLGKKVLVLLGGLMLLPVAYAVWLLLLQGSFTGYVVSDDLGLSFTQEFGDVTINTTSGASSETSSSQILNNNGDVVMTLTSAVTKTDNSDDLCTDYENDCDVTYSSTTTPSISNGGSFTLPSGVSEFNTTITCLERSCPQNVSVDITLEEE